MSLRKCDPAVYAARCLVLWYVVSLAAVPVAAQTLTILQQLYGGNGRTPMRR